MTENPAPPAYEPLEAALTSADDRLLLNHWMPPQAGIVPRIRFGQHWVSTLWGLPIGATTLIFLIAIAQSLRELPGVKAFIKQYPGIAQTAPSVDSGFPWWLQLQHFVNMFFMMFIIRAGIQILADHPRLYWKRTQRREPTGSASGSRSRKGGYGPPRMIPCPFPDGWASPASAIR